MAKSLYISDTGNNRIIERAIPDLSYVDQLTSIVVTETINLNSPRRVAVNGTSLFIYDQNVNKIYKLSLSDLSILENVFSTSAYSVGDFSVDANYVYVANTSGSVVRLNLADLTFVDETTTFNVAGIPDTYYPFDVCSDGTYIYVADAMFNRVVKIKIADMPDPAAIGDSIVSTEAMNAPSSICYSGGFVFVTDFWNARVVKFNASDLTLDSAIGSIGPGDDQFNSPGGISTDGTSIYIADSDNSRIVKRSMSLVYEAQSNNTDYYPVDTAVLGSFLYVADPYSPLFTPRIAKLAASDFTYDADIAAFSGPVYYPMTSPTGICNDGTFVYILYAPHAAP